MPAPPRPLDILREGPLIENCLSINQDTHNLALLLIKNRYNLD